MCGIFGGISKKDSSLKFGLFKSRLNGLFKLSESRGKEASGLALLSNKTIYVYKQAVPASELIKSKTYKDLFVNYPIAALGHTRLVTDGQSDDNHNNQPVIKGGIVCVHNGIIVNFEDLWKQFPSLEREYQVDTEILPSLLGLFLEEKNDLAYATEKTFRLVNGTASIAALFTDKSCLLLATNNGSLYFAKDDSGDSLLFASEKYILQKLNGKFKISHIENKTGCIISLNNLEIKRISLTEPGGFAPNNNENPPYRIVDISAYKEKPENQGRPPKDFAIPQDFIEEYERNMARLCGLRRCAKCVLPATMPFIEFDEKGICNYCRNYKRVAITGKEVLENNLAQYRCKSKEADCLFPFSGGRDSSYGLHYVKKILKMNPVAYSFDWGMVTDLARRNQSRICEKLGVEHLIISADIKKKRENIKKNITAWLKNPDLGMIPLFMAGDKQYFYYANQLKKRLGVKLIIYSETPLERTDFKSGFCHIKPKQLEENIHRLRPFDTMHLAFYYLKQFLLNPAHLNNSLWDSFTGFLSHYLVPHDFLFLYHYIRWNESEVVSTLINEYDWETAADTNSTWRIGDGTAAFYNYIYHTVAGFSENDTLRSNQIREGAITREEALKKIREENKPRYESIKWYCDTIGMDFEHTLRAINAIHKLY